MKAIIEKQHMCILMIDVWYKHIEYHPMKHTVNL